MKEEIITGSGGGRAAPLQRVDGRLFFIASGFRSGGRRRFRSRNAGSGRQDGRSGGCRHGSQRETPRIGQLIQILLSINKSQTISQTFHPSTNNNPAGMKSLTDPHQIRMESAWNPHGICIESVWNLYGIRMESAWNLYGIRMESARNMTQCQVIEEASGKPERVPPPGRGSCPGASFRIWRCGCRPSSGGGCARHPHRGI